jgi:hypothetical protein
MVFYVVNKCLRPRYKRFLCNCIVYGQFIQAISVLLRQGTSSSDWYIKFWDSVTVAPSTVEKFKMNVRVSVHINVQGQCSRSPITLTLHTPRQLEWSHCPDNKHNNPKCHELLTWWHSNKWQESTIFRRGFFLQDRRLVLATLTGVWSQFRVFKIYDIFAISP